jgi:hypothetical protein
MNDEELRELAKKRVEFRDHVIIYAVMNVFFAAINLAYSPSFWWFIFIALFWGLGLAFHWRDAYYGPQGERIEKEYQKLKKEKGKK